MSSVSLNKGIEPSSTDSVANARTTIHCADYNSFYKVFNVTKGLFLSIAFVHSKTSGHSLQVLNGAKINDSNKERPTICRHKLNVKLENRNFLLQHSERYFECCMTKTNRRTRLRSEFDLLLSSTATTKTYKVTLKTLKSSFDLMLNKLNKISSVDQV